MPEFPSSRARRAALAAAAVVLLALAPVAAAPDAEHTEEDARYGRVRVRAWAGLHAKVQRSPGRGAGGPTPIGRGTVLLLQVSRLPRPTRAPQDVWLWWQGPPGAAPDLATAWRASVARFALEHTLRFCNLGI